MAQPKIFVSHSSLDNAFATKLARIGNAWHYPWRDW